MLRVVTAFGRSASTRGAERRKPIGRGIPPETGGMSIISHDLVNKTLRHWPLTLAAHARGQPSILGVLSYELPLW